MTKPPDSWQTAARRSAWQVETVGGLFNIAYLMLSFAIPLYAIHIHLALWAIAVLTALPGVFLIVQRILSGPLTAALGEVPVLRLSLALGMVAGFAPLVGGGSLASLVVAQVMSGAMRGLFWTAAQSYMTRLPGEVAARLGHFTGAANLGGLIGIVATGPLVAMAGYPVVFGVVGLCQAAALACTLGILPLRSAAPPVPMRQALRALPHLLRYSTMWLAGGIALLAAIPQALVQSFYPIWALHVAHSAATASVVISLRNVGTITGSFLSGRLLKWTDHRTAMILGVVGLAASIFLTSTVSQPWLLAVILFATGFFSAPIAILYLALVVGVVPDQDRASAMAVVNVFWSAAMLLTPLVFGALAQLTGMGSAFHWIGIGVGIAVLPLALPRFWRALAAEQRHRAATRVPSRSIAPGPGH